MTHRLKDGSTVEDPRLGRLVEFDRRSRQHPVMATLTSTQQQRPRSMTWSVNTWIDQGQEGSCVGHGIAHDLAARPVRIPNVNHEFAVGLYFDAQKIDPWEGGAYPGASEFYEGTSVLSGIKVAQSRGYYGAYKWAFSEEELMFSVGYKGPAIIGVNWYEGMGDPDSRGFIRPTGRVTGGHCTLIYAVSIRLGLYKIWNSWGPSWGQNGTALMTREDMAELLRQDGEVCIPIERRVPNAV